MKQPFVNATIASKRKGKEASAHCILTRTDREECHHFEKQSPTPIIKSEPVQVGVVGGRKKNPPKKDESADVKGLLGKAMKEGKVEDVLSYFKLKSLP